VVSVIFEPLHALLSMNSLL